MNKSKDAYSFIMRQKGIALLPVAIIITVVAAISLLLSYESSMNVNETVAELEAKQADLVAEAGMAHAKWQLTQNTSCSNYTNIAVTNFGSHNYTASISPTSGSPVTISASGVTQNGVTRNLTGTNTKVYQTAYTKEYILDENGKDSFIEGEEGHHDHNKGNDKNIRINSQSDKIDRGLVQFDISDLNESAKIINATLELYLNDSVGNNDTIFIHRVTNSWEEDEVTWIVKRSGFLTNWNPAGGEFVSTAAGSFVADTVGWKSADITQLVQDWVKVPSINQGMILLATPASGNSEKKFTSSDGDDASLHPKLTITYACECGQTCLNPTMEDLLFVVSDPANLDAQEISRQELFETWGYTVGLIDDSASQGDFDKAINDYDVVYVSEEIDHTKLSDKLRDAPIGVVNEEQYLYQEFGFSSSRSYKSLNELEIVNNTHYITSVFLTGIIEVYTSNQPSSFIKNPVVDLQILGNMNETGPNWFPVLGTLDVGDEMYGGGQAPARRVKLPWADIDVSALNENGQTITRRAIEWAAGANGEENNSGLIAHWMLDESSGSIAKDSINGFDGELKNNPEWNASGRIDGALLFDNVNAQVVVPHSDELSPKNTLTISAWIYNDASFLVDSYRILSKESFGSNDNYFLSMGADALFFGVGGEFFSPANTLSSNQWYHVAATFDDGADEVRMYIDGAEVLTQSTTASLTPNTDDVYIGSNWQEYKWWEGLIDDVRLYDYALTSSEIADIFSSAPEIGGGGSNDDALKAPVDCSNNYLDQFNTNDSYQGNDGGLTWTNDWQEINEDGSASSGDEQVTSDDINLYVLQVRDNDGGGEGVYREADLSNYTNATLNFNYRRKGLDNTDDYIAIGISNNGGSSWIELDRIEGPGTDSSYQTFSQDISAYISSNTNIRFLTSSSNGSTDTVFFDNVEIAVSGCVE